MSKIFEHYRIKARSTLAAILIIALQIIWILWLNDWQLVAEIFPLLLGIILLIDRSTEKKINERKKKEKKRETNK